jgi:2-polyprenyl-3-methyl-5-hydroxy-6-metoxy-1,4-benzoquinol methylase
MSLRCKEIEAYYLQSRESERLSNEWGELERLRTQAILARNLPSATAVIFDVDGGAGVYALPLAKQGYEVHLIDAVDLHFEQARTYAAESNSLTFLLGICLSALSSNCFRFLPSYFEGATLS